MRYMFLAIFLSACTNHLPGVTEQEDLLNTTADLGSMPSGRPTPVLEPRLVPVPHPVLEPHPDLAQAAPKDDDCDDEGPCQKEHRHHRCDR